VKTKILIAVIFSAFCAASLLGADKFTVKLPNRQFTPPPGLDPELEKQLAQTHSFPVHALVQLFQMPSDAERGFLREAGLELMQNIDKTVFLADLSKRFKFKVVSHLVRWAGPLFPEDKIEHAFWESKVRDRKSSNAKVKIVVQFYGDVSPDAVQYILRRHTDSFRRFGRNAFWEAETSYYRLMALAGEPDVRWIEERTTNILPTSQ
jgi:hypothetical protein